jgi:hypothetical protein
MAIRRLTHPAQVERPVQVDRKVFCPVVVGHRLRPAHLVSPSDVDKDVESAQLADALLDRVPADLRRSNVRQRVRTTFHVGEYLGQAPSVPAYSENRCALPGKQPGRLSARPDDRPVTSTTLPCSADISSRNATAQQLKGRKHLRSPAPLEPRLLDDAVIVSIARRLGKTPAQVLLAWSIQRGSAVLTSSVKPARIGENFDVTALPESAIQEISERLETRCRFNSVVDGGEPGFAEVPR